MVVSKSNNKRKKFHDKDKYYRLAKEQGLRSRAAFKLSQINRKFNVLEKAETAILDLCAAPGGWTQIAARTAPSHVLIVAVDILPMRNFKTTPNVTTIIGDITTDKCRSDIRHVIHHNQVDVVLHDGAPNVGAEYGKDAYEQNELALMALKTAVSHLKQNGTFVTKVYRSRDYASYLWVLQQLFDHVQAVKPAASRPQSAEIFIVATCFKAPRKIDPKLLDPKHVFETVEGETTGGSGNNQAVTIFHKNWDKKTRKRGGYDHEHLDMTMRHVVSVREFCSVGLKDAIQMLSTSTELSFRCNSCNTNCCDECHLLLHHPFTMTEIKECCQDLQLLNRVDFKGLLNWRTKMQQALEARRTDDDTTMPNAIAVNDETVKESREEQDSEDEEEEDEEQVQKEIAEMRQRKLREKKRKRKKERSVAAKRRRNAAFGMDLNAVDITDEAYFTLSDIPTAQALDKVSEVNLDHITDEQLLNDTDDQDVVIGHDSDDSDNNNEDDQAARQRRRERDLDEAYNQYILNTKDGRAKSGTKMQKRSKKLQRLKIAQEVEEDQEMAVSADVAYNVKAYAKLLQGSDDEGDESDNNVDDDNEDDGFGAEPMTPAEHTAAVAQQKKENPLIHQFPDEPTSAKTARWFSNPLFASIGKAAAINGASRHKADNESDKMSSSSDGDTLTADKVIASMPMTDKQKRHEKRLKQMVRDERKKERRARLLGETEGDFQLVKAAATSDSEEEDEDQKLDHLSDSQKKKILDARELIKAGLGNVADDETNKSGIEIVAKDESVLPIMDHRKYDSDHEDYDSDDYAQTLALGTMILRKSKEKAFVDASYNRYAWNDPADLPDWFVDDENKHYRPQLPIPPALLAKMKEKMAALSTKPIKKVAEARARKSKRAKDKLAAAKKKAESVANATEMTESMKLKAISKALRVQETKKPGKTYVVAKKGRANKVVKGAMLVDKRMKSDKRSMARAEKKRTKGKQNKRRHHK